MSTRSRSRLPRGETTHPIPSAVPQNFPICQPVVYLYSNDQAAHHAALAKFNDDVARLPTTNTLIGEGWIKDPNANHAYMISAPPLPPPAPTIPNPMEVAAETRHQREERLERFNKTREEALQRAAAAPKRARERPSQPEGHIDKRTQQKQLAEERKARKDAYRKAHPAARRRSQRNRTPPSGNVIFTRAMRRELVEADREFYVSGSTESWDGRRKDRVEGWRQDVIPNHGHDDDDAMEDVQDLGCQSRSSLAPEDALEFAGSGSGGLV
ncbi:MAG: hypothetical protein L6R42_000684 [Xanthoria sp. 1 TBL-2021]|nr:MAG: hypothetical protein L6R42_000684 [Xanthoria sp. 1 TBL-2021]